ncbi:MAG: hypothetical protein ACJ74O_04110 [Frankiaceae bacterium]
MTSRAHPGPEDGTGPTKVENPSVELDRVRAERDAAVADLQHYEHRGRRRGWVRRTAVGVLVALFAVLVPVTATAAWTHRTVLNTEAYVATVRPIASDPAVTSAASRQVTNQLYATLDPQSIIANALPPKAAFLAGPIADALKGSLRSKVNDILNSAQFQQLWVEANRFAHGQLVAVLRGDTSTLRTTKGQVVLNLVPLVNAALQRASALVAGVVGKPVTLPKITSDELPSAACERIAAALSRPVPPTCGQIVLFPAANLTAARRAVRAFDRGVVALLVITPLLALLALWLSRRRRRTLLQLVIGGMLGVVVVRRALFWEQDRLISSGPPENEDARRVIVHGLLNGFFGLTEWILIGGFVIAVLAVLSGPYRWAVAMRSGVVHGVRATSHLVSVGAKGTVAQARDEATIAWLRRHLDALRIAAVVVAVLLLLFLDVSFPGFLVIVALLALAQIGLYRLRPADPAGPPPSDPSSTPPRQRSAQA